MHVWSHGSDPTAHTRADALLKCHDRGVERPTPKVEDEDSVLLLGPRVVQQQGRKLVLIADAFGRDVAALQLLLERGRGHVMRWAVRHLAGVAEVADQVGKRGSAWLGQNSRHRHPGDLTRLRSGRLAAG